MAGPTQRVALDENGRPVLIPLTPPPVPAEGQAPTVRRDLIDEYRRTGLAREPMPDAKDAVPPTGRPATEIAPPMPPQREPAAPPAREASGRGEPIAPPPSGTLPGEEQVTTRDVFNRLKPDQKAALQAKYEANADKDRRSFDDFLSETFGDLPPQERAAAMVSAATPAPAAPQPVSGGMAGRRRATGRYLPEGMQPEDYSPQQARDMSHNFFFPEIPMQFGRGTNVVNPDGSTSMRAPDPKLLAVADAFPTDQLWSEAHLRALGNAYGIKVDAYAPQDLPILRADVLKMHKLHERQRKVSTPQDVGQSMAGTPIDTGSMRYAPDSKKQAAAQAARDADMPLAERQRLADAIEVRFGSAEFFTPEISAAIQQAVTTPDGPAILRSINQRLTHQRNVAAAAAARSRANNFNMTRDVQNPRYAPGMSIRSLMSEADRQNPLRMAVAYEVAGMPAQAQDMRAMAAAQQQGAMQMAAQAQAAQLAGDANPSLASQRDKQMADIFQSARTPADRLNLVKQVVRRENTTPDGALPDEKMVHSTALREVAERVVQTNPQDPAVQEYLQDLSNRGQRDEFIGFLTRAPMRLSVPEAEQRWARAGGWGLAGFGRAAEGSLNAAGRAIGTMTGGR